MNQMHHRLIEAVLLAWTPVVIALFRAIGPRRAVLVATLGGFLFLPVGQVKLGVLGFPFPVDKWNATGLGLLLGALFFGRRAMSGARLGWLDLPMAAYYLAPLIGLATGRAGSSADILDVMIGRGLGWVVPYAMGRIYFREGDGPAAVAVALVVAGLCYIPICLYEEVAGPTRYLGGLLYGLSYNPGMVDRLGGWRPEGFLGDGLSVAAWMALTAVIATWLWLGGWRSGRPTSWAPAVAMVLASLSCRGVYGYLILGLGISSALLTRGLRSRAILATLAVVPLLYMALRATGAWDGGLLVGGAAALGRESTVAWRVQAEDEVIGRVIAYNPLVGVGGYIWNAGLPHWPDGRWLHSLWMGGLVGLGLQTLALNVLPAWLALSKPSRRPDPRQAAAPSWGLACWCLLQLIDGMHNTSYITPTALIAGTLVGFASWKGEETFGPALPRSSRVATGRGLPIPLILTVIALLGVEILGRLRDHAPSPSNAPTPAVGNREAPP